MSGLKNPFHSRRRIEREVIINNFNLETISHTFLAFLTMRNGLTFLILLYILNFLKAVYVGINNKTEPLFTHKIGFGHSQIIFF